MCVYTYRYRFLRIPITQFRYTMSGPEEMDEDGHERGLISRAVDMIFDEVEALRFKGWTYDVSVSHLEIYNENLRDLMAQPSQELCVLLLVCGAVCCSVLPCVAVRICGIAWRRRRTICANVVLCCSVLQRLAACCSVLQCVAVRIYGIAWRSRCRNLVCSCCCVLQCVAGYCRVLQSKSAGLHGAGVAGIVCAHVAV